MGGTLFDIMLCHLKYLFFPFYMLLMMITCDYAVLDSFNYLFGS